MTLSRFRGPSGASIWKKTSGRLNSKLTQRSLPPSALFFPDALAILGKELGHTYTYLNVTEEAARQSMEGTGMPVRLVDGFLELNALVQQDYSQNLAKGVQDVLARNQTACVSGQPH